MKINIKDITYDNVVLDRGPNGDWVYAHVQNLEYPVSQKALDELHDRLPRFVNSMGELYLVQEDA